MKSALGGVPCLNLFGNHTDDLHEEGDAADDEEYVSNDDGDNYGCDRRTTQPCVVGDKMLHSRPIGRNGMT